MLGKTLALSTATTCSIAVTYDNRKTQINAPSCSFPQFYFGFKMLINELECSQDAFRSSCRAAELRAQLDNVCVKPNHTKHSQTAELQFSSCLVALSPKWSMFQLFKQQHFPQILSTFWQVWWVFLTTYFGRIYTIIF